MAATASPSSRTQTTSSSSRFFSSPFASYTSANFVSTASSSFSAPSSYGHHHHHRSSPSSPPSPTSSVRFSVDHRQGSPGRRSMTLAKNHQRNNGAVSSSSSTHRHQKRTCMCSPTTHPGSFRCAYHKRLAEQQQQKKEHQTASCHSSSSMSSSNKLNLRRSAMKNSLVRIGGVEGELVKRALTTLIRPSSHHQRRREAFQPRPSRLSIMSKG